MIKLRSSRGIGNKIHDNEHPIIPLKYRPRSKMDVGEERKREEASYLIGEENNINK